MTLPSPVRVDARAKVNLYIHVIGRRPDGYHLLDSLVVFPEIGDVVEVAPADALTLAVSGPFAKDIPAGSDNLVVRAAQALAAAAGRKPAARIELVKRLPVAAGIGGGSADAAAALHALARLWRLPPGSVDLAQIALALGADVPMCVAGHPALVSGIGECLAPGPPLPAFSMLLANPGIAVSTPIVFAHRSGPFSDPAPITAQPADAGALAKLLGTRRNDLEAAAEGVAPKIGVVRAALAATPGALLARMSGSGATCFAIYATQGQAEAARETMATRYPDWWLAAAPVASFSRSG